MLASNKQISRPRPPQAIKTMIETDINIQSCPFGTALSAHLIDLLMGGERRTLDALFSDSEWSRRSGSGSAHDVDLMQGAHQKKRWMGGFDSPSEKNKKRRTLSFFRRLQTIMWYDVVKNRGSAGYYGNAAMIAGVGVCLFAVLFHRPIQIFEAMGGDFAKRLFCFFGMTLLFDFIMRFKTTTFNEDAQRYRMERYSLVVTPLTTLLGTIGFDLMYINLSTAGAVFLLRGIMRMDSSIASVVVWNLLFNVFLQVTFLWNRIISFSGLEVDLQTSVRGFAHFIVIGYNGILLPIGMISAWLSWLCYFNPLYYSYSAMMKFDGLVADSEVETGSDWSTAQYAVMGVVELWICFWLHYVQLRSIQKWTM